jgi:hypothetical protein
MTSRSDSTPVRNSTLNLDSRSLRPNPAFISPSFEDLQRQQSQLFTPPHSLRRPSEVMPNQAAVETLQSDMDEESDNNSIRSTMSHSVQNDISIPAPPLQDYADFIEWLSYNFAP